MASFVIAMLFTDPIRNSITGWLEGMIEKCGVQNDPMKHTFHQLSGACGFVYHSRAIDDELGHNWLRNSLLHDCRRAIT